MWTSKILSCISAGFEDTVLIFDSGDTSLEPLLNQTENKRCVFCLVNEQIFWQITKCIKIFEIIYITLHKIGQRN